MFEFLIFNIKNWMRFFMNTNIKVAFLNSYRRKLIIYSIMPVASPGHIIILFAIIMTGTWYLARIESPVMDICVYMSKIVVYHAIFFSNLALCSTCYGFRLIKKTSTDLLLPMLATKWWMHQYDNSIPLRLLLSITPWNVYNSFSGET